MAVWVQTGPKNGFVLSKPSRFELNPEKWTKIGGGGSGGRLVITCYFVFFYFFSTTFEGKGRAFWRIYKELTIVFLTTNIKLKGVLILKIQW